MNRYMFKISTGGVVNFFADSYDEAWQQLVQSAVLEHRCELDEFEKDCTKEEYNSREEPVEADYWDGNVPNGED